MTYVSPYNLKLGDHYKKGKIEVFSKLRRDEFSSYKEYKTYDIFYAGTYVGHIKQDINTFFCNPGEMCKIPFTDKDYIGGSLLIFKKIRTKIYLQEIIFNLNLQRDFVFERHIMLEKFKNKIITVGDYTY